MRRNAWAILMLCGALASCRNADGGALDRDGAPGDAAPDSGGAGHRTSGTVIDLQGRPIAGAMVELCAPCRGTLTDAKGRFEFDGVSADPPTGYSVHARLAVLSPEWAEVTIPVYQLDVVLKPLLLPHVGPGAAPHTMPGASLLFPVDATLVLELPDTLAFAPGAPRTIAAVQIPAPLFPDFCLPSVQVIAMWAFAPAGTTSSDPIRLFTHGALGLGAGAAVQAVTIDPATGRPGDQFMAQVTPDGGSIETGPSGGVKRLTWLVLGSLGGGP